MLLYKCIAHAQLFATVNQQRLVLNAQLQSNLSNTDTEGTEQSVLERCPFFRGHHDHGTLKTFLTVLSVQYVKTDPNLSFCCI